MWATERPCAECGRPFAPLACNVKAGKGRHCSKACGTEGQKKTWARKQQDRFWKKVDRSGGPDACWPWTGCLQSMGYGATHIGRKYTLAHRASWVWLRGDIPDGMFVCHRCDNPRCCNPAHLFVGTAQDNTDDMLAKGRARFFGQSVPARPWLAPEPTE